MIQVEVFWVVTLCSVVVRTSEMLVSYHNTKWHHNPEALDLIFTTAKTLNLASSLMTCICIVMSIGLQFLSTKCRPLTQEPVPPMGPNNIKGPHSDPHGSRRVLSPYLYPQYHGL